MDETICQTPAEEKEDQGGVSRPVNVIDINNIELQSKDIDKKNRFTMNKERILIY